jgi:ATP-dependent exoDNAse (exonuclease V) alpha subunit
LKQNIWKERGLYNGSKGTIEDFHFSDDGEMKAILIKFDDFNGIGIGDLNLVPIEPILIENKENRKHTRYLFPIDLGYGITIYKA